MDDISTLEQMTDAIAREAAHLFKPRDQYRLATAAAVAVAADVAVAAAPQAVTPENAPVASDGAESAERRVVQFWLKTGGEDRRPRLPRRRPAR